MIPIVHLSDCPEPPAYVPDEQVLVAYITRPPFFPIAWQVTCPDKVPLRVDEDPTGSSSSYRMF